MSVDQYLFVEKYRPRKINDCVLPSAIQDQFKLLVDPNSGVELGHMLFTGTAGVGKTTVAKALCNELNLDYLMINASEEGNIDTLRTKIRQFASTVSLQGGYKVVILDEADFLTSTTQPALRGFFEEFSDNCRFILTCNFKNRIIKPLQSRCTEFDFTIPSKERMKIAAAFFKRLLSILDKEQITYDKKVVAALIEKYFPDWRRLLNAIQNYSLSGTIDSGILSSLDDSNFEALFERLKNKDFSGVRKWVSENVDVEPRVVFRALYDKIESRIAPAHIPNVIMLLAQYQYWDGLVADPEINLVACLTEIMMNTEFK